MKDAVRLDQHLVQAGLFASRARARAAIDAGLVLVDGVAGRPATPVTAATRVDVLGDPVPFAGRGGVKLAHALDAFGVDPAGKVCLDVGASTGGFTDCLLRKGAAFVHAVDVGRGQFSPKLATDARVSLREGTDIRLVPPGALSPVPSLATVDVSFIGACLILPAVRGLVTAGGRAELVVLVKPQFELGPGGTRRGLVRDPRGHSQAILGVSRCAERLGLAPVDLTYSPVTGGSGNLEFFLYLRADGRGTLHAGRVEEVVLLAKERLGPAANR